MAFENKVPEWIAEGVEPPQSLKESGFAAGYKPPADYFNWFFHGTAEALKELQEKAGHSTLFITLSGNDDDGYTVDKTFDEIVTALNGGHDLKVIEIFGGPYVVYSFIGVEYDYFQFCFQSGMYCYLVRIFRDRVTRFVYRMYNSNYPPNYEVVGAEPLGAVNKHDKSTTAHAGMFAPAGYGLGGGAKDITGVDPNTVTANGWYTFNAGHANYPNGAGQAYDTMFVVSRNENYVEQFVFQSVGDYHGTMHKRERFSGTWQPWEWVNPPMVLGTEYRTTERIGNKAVYKKNVDGVIQYRLDGETEWKPYSNAVGAAPAGYGLGTEHPVGNITDDLNNAVKTGVYVYSHTAANVPPIDASDTLVVISYSEKWKVQYIYWHSKNCVLRRFMRGGNWDAWEFDNPPRYLGIEYRTTERWQGMPVYQKTILFGNLPNNTTKSVAHGITGLQQVIWKEGNIAYTTLSGNTNITAFWTDATNISITTKNDQSGYASAITLKYTKS